MRRLDAPACTRSAGGWLSHDRHRPCRVTSAIPFGLIAAKKAGGPEPRAAAVARPAPGGGCRPAAAGGSPGCSLLWVDRLRVCRVDEAFGGTCTGRSGCPARLAAPQPPLPSMLAGRCGRRGWTIPDQAITAGLLAAAGGPAAAGLVGRGYPAARWGPLTFPAGRGPAQRNWNQRVPRIPGVPFLGCGWSHPRNKQAPSCSVCLLAPGGGPGLVPVPASQLESRLPCWPPARVWPISQRAGDLPEALAAACHSFRKYPRQSPAHGPRRPAGCGSCWVAVCGQPARWRRLSTRRLKGEEWTLRVRVMAVVCE